MSRTLTSGQETAIQQSGVAIILFIELNFGSGMVRIHTGEGPIIWGGFTWDGLGRITGIDAIQESEGGAIPGLTISLTGAFTAYLALALTEPHKGRPANLYVGICALPELTLLDTPVLEYSGKMDTMPIKMGGYDQNGNRTCMVGVTIENELFDFDRPNPWYWSDEVQQRDYPGDKFLQYITQMSTREIVWPNREWFKR